MPHLSVTGACSPILSERIAAWTPDASKTGKLFLGLEDQVSVSRVGGAKTCLPDLKQHHHGKQRLLLCSAERVGLHLSNRSGLT